MSLTTAPKGALRQAIDNLFLDGPIQAVLKQGTGTRADRRKEWVNLLNLAKEADEQRYTEYRSSQGYPYDRGSYIWMGNVDALNALQLIINREPFHYDLSAKLAETIKEGFSNPRAREFIETIGTIYVDPVLSLFEQYAAQENPDPKEFLRAVSGVITTIDIASGLMSLTVNGATKGMISNAGDALGALTRDLGLESVARRATDSIFTYGLFPRLDRYYKRLYRNTRFSPSEARDLFALGEITQDQLYTALKDDGWRDEDISKWIRLAYKNVSESVLFDLYDNGDMSQEDLIKRLRASGYDTSNIQLILLNHRNQTSQEATDVSLSTLRSSFKKDLISESEYRSLLTKLKKSSQEIDLLIALDSASKKADARDLSISQIKAAYNQAIIAEAEAVYQIKQLGYSADSAAILMDTWQRENVPNFVKLNRTTILDAYRYGVLQRGETLAKLQSVGFTAGDAELNVKLLEIRNPEILLPAEKRTSKVLTPGTLTSLVMAGIITPENMQGRLIALNYTQEDASALTDLARLKASQQPLPLTQSAIERAYLVGVLNRDEAHAQLLGLGFDETGAQTILATLERENITVFYPDQATFSVLPSISVLARAYKNGVITEQTFYTRAAEIGYSSDDAKLYLVVAETTAVQNVKTLSQAQAVNAYGAGLLTRSQTQDRLLAMGYSGEDITILLRMEKADVADSDLWSAMIAGALSADDTIAALINAKYAVPDIKAAFNKLTSGALAQLNINLAELNLAFDQLIARGG
jgi:hypothetical protein